MSYFENINCEELTSEIKKAFRMYRFKDINKANDYTILYFTYKLYKEYISENNDCVPEDAAKQFADYAKSRLSRHKSKKSPSVTCENLLTFVRKSGVSSPNYNYIKIFINYIQSVYFCGADDVLKYAIFFKFRKLLMLILVFLSFFTTTPIPSALTIDFGRYEDLKKINKYVLNQMRALSNSTDENAVKIKSLVSKIRKEFRELTKKDRSSEKMTVSKFRRSCLQFSKYLLELSDYQNTKMEKMIYNIINAYLSFRVTVAGHEIPMLFLIESELIDHMYIMIKNPVIGTAQFSNDLFGGNIFLQLLFSGLPPVNDYIVEFDSSLAEIIEHYRHVLKGQFVQDAYAEIESYRRIVRSANLNFLNSAIFELDSFSIDYIALHMEKVLF